MTHYCTVCCRPLEAHREACDCGRELSYFPALCCPGCDCGSWEEAHKTGEKVELVVKGWANRSNHHFLVDPP